MASPPPTPTMQQTLFPAGAPTSREDVESVMEQYKLMLQSAESLEGRRQILHTFFMSINSLLVAAIGLIGKESLDTPAIGIGVIVLGLTGAVMSASWLQQIGSHQDVLASKWQVINEIEAALPSRPFAAEWQALQQRKYRSFTAIECRVPRVFVAVYAISCIAVGVLLLVEIVW